MITRTAQLLGMGVLAVASTMGGSYIDETTHVKLGSALAVAGVIVPAAWWMSSKFTKLMERMDEVGALRQELAALRRTVEELPCKSGTVCATQRHPPPHHTD